MASGAPANNLNNRDNGLIQEDSSSQIRSGATMPASATGPGVSTSTSETSGENKHLSSSTQETILDMERQMEDEGAKDRPPPMSVIVVSSSPAPAPNMDLGLPAGLSSRREARVNTTASVFSTPFRLQPRHAMGGGSTGMPGRDGAIRGRKRSAQSMNASKVGRNSLLLTTKPHPAAAAKPPASTTQEAEGKPFSMAESAVATTPKRQPPSDGSTPPRDTSTGLGRMDNTMVNFQCLSLQSPKRKHPSTPKLFPSPPQSLASHPSGLPPSSSSSSSGAQHHHQQRTAMVAGSGSGGGGSFHQSPGMSQTRSSFTPVYNSASPGGGGSIRSYSSGSIGSSARMNVGCGGQAGAAAQPLGNSGSGGSSTKSSPKLAPLTVLQGRGAKLLPNRYNTSRLPPLPGGSMSSLWLSLESSDNNDNGEGGKSPNKDDKVDDGVDEAKMWPPRTVHCRNPSSDSISTVQNSVLSPLPRPSPGTIGMRSSFSPAGTPGAYSAPKTSTPRSIKQRRLDEYISPSHQPTPRTPRTPLPRVTLTPRSSGSRRSRRSNGQQQQGQGLPRFPSPSDVDMDVTSPFLNSAAAANLRDVSRMVEETSGSTTSSIHPPARREELGTTSSFCPASSNSLALSADGSTNEGKEGSHSSAAAAAATTAGGRKKGSLPVLDLSPKKMDATSIASRGSSSSSPVVRDFSGGTFMGIQTMSLLNSSRTGGILQAMMEESATNAGGIHGGTEMGSVSDIDEDEGFILASPSAIEQERFSSCQPARQRRRRSCDHFAAATTYHAHGRGSPSLSPTANLAGMNYVTSNTSLFGMDIAHPTENNGVPANPELGRTPKTTCTLSETASSWKTATTKPERLTGDLGVSVNTQETQTLSVNTQETQTLKRRKSDASIDSVGLALDVTAGGDGDSGGRDLVTPPTMPNPETPPPLSPKEGFFMPIVMPEGTVQHNFERRQTASVCIAGADRKSVTMAIARMATEAQGHADSSPVL